MLGSSIAFGLSSTTYLITNMNLAEGSVAFLSYGWRIPVVLFAVLVVIGLWIRMSLDETPVFCEQQAPQPEYQQMVDKVRTAHAELIGLANTTQDDGLALPLRKIANQLYRDRRTQPNTHELSPREVEVFGPRGMGCTYAEVAGRFALQLATVKGYMRNVLAKVQVTNRHEAVVVARQCGIIPSTAPARHIARAVTVFVTALAM